MRGRRRFWGWLICCGVLLVLAAGAACFYWFQLAKPDPVLAGKRPIQMDDLPLVYQGLSDDQLRIKLDHLIAESRGDRPEDIWWASSLELAECGDAARLALYLGDERSSARSLLWLAHRLQFDRSLPLALAYLEHVKAIAQRAGLKEELAQCYKQQGDCLEWARACEWSLAAYEQAYREYLELDDIDRASYALTRLASWNGHRLSRYETALEYFEESYRLAWGRVEAERMVPKLCLWALSLESCGRYEEASDVFGLATDAAEEAGDPERMQRCLWLSALARENLGDCREAEEALRRAVALNPRVEPDARDRYQAHRELARLLFASGERDEALALYEGILVDIAERRQAAIGQEIEKRILDQLRSEEIKALGAIGALWSEAGDAGQALEYLRRAEELGEGESYLMPDERMEGALAQVYLELDRYEDALEQLRRAEECGPGG